MESCAGLLQNNSLKKRDLLIDIHLFTCYFNQLCWFSRNYLVVDLWSILQLFYGSGCYCHHSTSTNATFASSPLK